jgi:hypothetical protein
MRIEKQRRPLLPANILNPCITVLPSILKGNKCVHQAAEEKERERARKN